MRWEHNNLLMIRKKFPLRLLAHAQSFCCQIHWAFQHVERVNFSTFHVHHDISIWGYQGTFQPYSLIQCSRDCCDDHTSLLICGIIAVENFRNFWEYFYWNLKKIHEFSIMIHCINIVRQTTLVQTLDESMI